MSSLLAVLTLARPDIVVGLGLAVAILVTLHVLLTKTEVSPAVGWIGLAWFSPFLGGLIYFVLGINRVQRRAMRLRGGGRGKRRGGRLPHIFSHEDRHLDALRRSIGAITQRRSEPGNSVTILANGDAAYPEMLAAIDGARQSVGLSSYIMRGDTTGRRFVASLKAAQARGVDVRVIVDGIGSGWLRSPAYAALSAAGIPVGRFMHSPLPWKMSFLNLRSHKKILVVDGTSAFTGGINIADQNVLATHPQHPVQDTHFHLRGPVVVQLVEAFTRDWSFVAGEDLDGPAWFPQPTSDPQAGEAEARVVTAGPDEDLEKVEYVVLQAISCAQTRIQIMTPYFLPDQRVMTALSLAAMRGVAVEIILPQESDHPLVDWAMRANVGTLLQDGGRIWRSAPPFRHTKAMIVDDHWTLIGSSNWDMRSFRLNFELCVEVYDRALATTLGGLMAQCQGGELKIAELDKRPLAGRLRDSATRLLLPYL